MHRDTTLRLLGEHNLQTLWAIATHSVPIFRLHLTFMMRGNARHHERLPN